MTSVYKNSFVLLGGISVLFLVGCQSAQERQAAELRDFLRAQVRQLEPLNKKVIQEKQKLYEINKTSPEANVEETRQNHKTELADLHRRIEEYPDLELTALAQEIRMLIDRRHQDVEALASENRRAQNWAEVEAAIDASAARRRQANRPWIPGRAKETLTDAD